MKCLSCNREMMNHQITTREHKIAYDLCSHCGGIWLDRGELDQMALQVEGSLETSSRRRTQDDDQPVRECPRCDGMELEKVHFIGYSGILLDLCPNCGGFWLDQGEMEMINREIEGLMKVTGPGFSQFISSGHIPYWHRRVETPSSETDFSEKVLPLKGAGKKGSTQLECPVCSGEKLDLYKAHGVEFESCPRCQGMFLDHRELTSLRDRMDRDNWIKLRLIDREDESVSGDSASPSGRLCPHCADVTMTATRYGQTDVMVDCCPRCRGIWLDGREMQEIVRQLKEKLAAMPVDELKAKLRQELQEVFTRRDVTWDEILNARAALSAISAVTVFGSPEMLNLVEAATTAGRSVGLS